MAEFLVLRKSFVREGFDLNSPKAGVLKKNSRIEVLERRLNADGVIRVRFAEGWLSEILKDGSKVLELVAGTAPEGQPARSA